jgi:hypothetical protein
MKTCLTERALLDLPEDAKVADWTSYFTNHLDTVYRELSLHVQMFPIWMLCFIALLGGPAQLAAGLAFMILLLQFNSAYRLINDVPLLTLPFG